MVAIKRPAEIQKMSDKLVEMGYHFDIEELSTGMVGMTCELGDELASIEICPNGVEIPETVDSLIESAYKKIIGDK